MSVEHGSKESPIKVEEIRYDKGQYVKWEYHFISCKIGFYQKVSQKLHEFMDKKIDEVRVKEACGTEHVFWFDVTEPLAQNRKALEKAAADLGLTPDLMR